MTAIATIDDTKRPAVVQLITDPRTAALLTPLLPNGMTLDRIATEVFFAAKREPKLMDCTPESVVRSVATALQRGLAIGETIHLVPMSVKGTLTCQAWNDYKGDIELVLRTGVCHDITANPVFEKEDFEYREELEPVLRHVPSKDGARGDLIGAYARARIRYGYYKVKWMTIDQIEAIRAKSKSWGPKDVAKCPPWYAVKTAIHALTKQLPKNPRFTELTAVFAGEELLDAGEVEPAQITGPTECIDKDTGEVLGAPAE